MMTEVPRYIPPELVDVEARFPWNGYRTGGAVVPLDAPVRDHPLRPRFVWGAVVAATRYELEVDDSCDPHGYAGCELPSPEAMLVTTETDVSLEEPLPVSMVAPVGRRYFWRVRACDEVECTAWSRVRYLHVGRAPSDYDGDGYPDLAIARHTSVTDSTTGGWRSQGDVRVWRGGPGGLDATRVVALREGAFELRAAHIGPIGDLNGDGYDELFTLAAPVTGEEQRPTGYRGTVWWGSAEGPRDPEVVPDPPDFEPTEVWLEPLGDLDADGFDDAYRPFAHSVAYGAADGVHVDDTPLLEPWFLPLPGVIDVNGDGHLDLVWPRGVAVDGRMASVLEWRLGAPGLRGPQTGVVTPSWVAHYDLDAPFVRIDDGDRDGFAELGVHSGLTDVYLFEGGASFLALWDPDVWLPGARDTAVWKPAASGDVNGDGFADVAVLRAHAEIEVAVLEGNAEGEAHIGTLGRVHEPEAGAIEGVASALHDFDGDGYDDQVWVVNVGERGAVGAAVDWRVLAFPGGPSGLPWQPTREIHRYGDDTLRDVVLTNGRDGWD